MDKELKDLNAFEVDLGSALKSTGYMFPTTETEMKCFLAHMTPAALPEKYQTPDFVFGEESAPVTSIRVNRMDVTETAQNWALAARNGKQLPQSILDKMKEDKNKACKK